MQAGINLLTTQIRRSALVNDPITSLPLREIQAFIDECYATNRLMHKVSAMVENLYPITKNQKMLDNVCDLVTHLVRNLDSNSPHKLLPPQVMERIHAQDRLVDKMGALEHYRTSGRSMISS